jgi:hypothetical protein
MREVELGLSSTLRHALAVLERPRRATSHNTLLELRLHKRPLSRSAAWPDMLLRPDHSNVDRVNNPRITFARDAPLAPAHLVLLIKLSGFSSGRRIALAVSRAWHREGKSCFTRIGLWRRCVTEWPRGHSGEKCKRCLCKRLRILMPPARRVLRTHAFARRLPRLELGSSHASFPPEPQCPFPTSRLVRPSS